MYFVNIKFSAVSSVSHLHLSGRKHLKVVQPYQPFAARNIKKKIIYFHYNHLYIIFASLDLSAIYEISPAIPFSINKCLPIFE